MNRSGLIGRFVTNLAAIPLTILAMILFVGLAFFISSNSPDYDLAEEFTTDFIFYNGRAIAVNQAIEELCNGENVELTSKLKKKFIEEYPSDSFAIVSKNSGGVGGWSYELHLFANVFEDRASESKPSVPRFDFEKAFEGATIKYYCDADNLQLYVMEGS